jgi:hypothetical protein
VGDLSFPILSPTGLPGFIYELRNHCQNEYSQAFLPSISTFLLWFSAFVVFIFIFFPQVIANLVADLMVCKS